MKLCRDPQARNRNREQFVPRISTVEGSKARSKLSASSTTTAILTSFVAFVSLAAEGQYPADQQAGPFA